MVLKIMVVGARRWNRMWSIVAEIFAIITVSATWYLGDWPQFHGDASHDGWNQAEPTLDVGNVAGLKSLWRIRAGRSDRFADPVVSNGIVYASESGFGV